MADMPAYAPQDRGFDDADDAFADEVAGNIYGAAPQTGGHNTRNALLGVAQGQLLGLAEHGKSELVGNIATIAGIVREVATQVQNLGVEPFAGYARQTTALVDDLHASIRDKSVEALIDDGRALVRQQPEIAIAAAIIAGFVGARILKARS